MKTPLFSSRHNHCYPYGLTFADAWKGASVQPYKFGGKELDAMYGLNIYDFHARTQTPYLFCANNPINNTDPTGMEVWFNDFMYTPGCEYFGDAKIYLNQALDRNGFISAVAHESMHVGQFLNGQGGRAIFNEVEAYAFEAATSLISFDLETPFNSGALSGENRYVNSMNQLLSGYSKEHFTNAMFVFTREASANNSGIYDSYSFMPNSRQLYHNNIKSILLKYSPW
ncbi:hypothetical protein E4T81_12930 [Barnesiella sp. WM24]|uniref:hypothetical protein n=1 Tax=Barnesiella sp. WM24 TaxID=2558278 RepID=UPI0010720CCD|nr:hypothetical protein [Barnesiella sp. WM24]TFU92211.1 hypothetical protein E4T81_12930 [Barnesiella sp. WM24]